MMGKVGRSRWELRREPTKTMRSIKSVRNSKSDNEAAPGQMRASKEWLGRVDGSSMMEVSR